MAQFTVRRAQRNDPLPKDVRARVDLARRERLLAAARSADGVWVLVGTARLYAVPPTPATTSARTDAAAGSPGSSAASPRATTGTPAPGAAASDPGVLARPWHLVDGGTWSHDDFTLTVTWVDGARPQQWVFRESTALLAAFRERVQASVVLAEVVPLGARQARVVIRKDLSDGTLHDQTILPRGARLSDPGVAEAVADARARLREQVGLAP